MKVSRVNWRPKAVETTEPCLTVAPVLWILRSGLFSGFAGKSNGLIGTLGAFAAAFGRDAAFAAGAAFGAAGAFCAAAFCTAAAFVEGPVQRMARAWAASHCCSCASSH